MTLLLVVCTLAVITVIAIDAWAWRTITTQLDIPGPVPNEFPVVAVLLPCRNEEQHLPGALKSLLQLDYPADKLVIVVGNDASTDTTLAIARQWGAKHPQIRVVDVQKNLGNARGKANVLAQLVHACPPEIHYFFMTDADIRPHMQWVKRMLTALRPGIGLVNGTTVVKGNSLWARWQQADWAIALGLSKAYTYLPKVGKTLSAIGNNMLVTRQAYEATGGYETIPFSITEDYELLQQLRKQGYEAVHLMDAPSSALTEPITSAGVLLHQRKRWMTGAMQLPLPMVCLLFVQALFFPAIVVVLLLHPLLGIAGLVVKLLAQYLLAKQVLQRTGIERKPAAGVVYELYSCILSCLLIVFYFLPITINWKDRNYRSNRV